MISDVNIYSVLNCIPVTIRTNSEIVFKKMGDQVVKTTVSPLLRSLLGNGQNTNDTNPVDRIVSSLNLPSTNLTTTHSPKLNDLDIRRSNIIWPADPVDEMPVK